VVSPSGPDWADLLNIKICGWHLGRDAAWWTCMGARAKNWNDIDPKRNEACELQQSGGSDAIFSRKKKRIEETRETLREKVWMKGLLSKCP